MQQAWQGAEEQQAAPAKAAPAKPATPPKAPKPGTPPKGAPTQSPAQTPVQTPPKPGKPPKPVTPPTPPKPPAPVQTPPKPPKPPKPPVATGGGGTPDRTRVTLTNHDRNSMVKLTSNKGTSVQISGDPHVIANVGGKVSKFDIGYGNGQINLTGGIAVKWDTFHNASRALLHFTIDAPGTKNDDSVSTNDGKDVENRLTVLTDAQLREFIQKLSAYRGAWNQPLHR